MPKIGGEWIYFSGKDIEACTAAYCGGVQGWHPMARGYYTTMIREFETSTQAGGFYGTDQVGDTSASTNQHQLALYGSFTPIEDLTIAPRLTWFILDKGIRPIGADGNATAKKKNYAGMEWDTIATYNYTDDVQFGLAYGIFAPGNVYRTPNDSVAQELISSVSVKF